MFEKSFTLAVTTDAQGRFHSTKPVTSPFSLDVKISATLLSPGGVTLHSSFAVGTADGSASAEPIQFTVASGETVDLGKWSVIAGEDANLAEAMGFTEPAAADTELKVHFVVSPSFF